MNNFFKKIIISLIIIINLPLIVHADSNNKTYKVGFYENKPYYFINENGEYDGYYYEILEEATKNLDVKFEYVDIGIEDGLKALESGSIDIMMGLVRTKEREEKYIFTDNYIGYEQYAVYTNKSIKYNSLHQLDGLKLSSIHNTSISDFIFNVLDYKNVNVKSINAKSENESIDLLLNNKVDAIVASISNPSVQNLNKLYEYSVGAVYIAGNKNNQEIINLIDQELNSYASQDGKDLRQIYNKYFNKYYKLYKWKYLFQITILIILYCFYKKYIDTKLKKRKIQLSIQSKLDNNNYKLYYQPIVNPQNNNIKGFEGLLRLIDSNLGVIPPYKFIKEIEDNDMLFDTSIWILKRAIEDYEKIKMNLNINSNFYVSINVSWKEIENNEFIAKYISLLKDSNLTNNQICIEVSEKIEVNNSQKIKIAISKLKEAGFMIAIDDFGVQYSNLNLLDKFDFDILKIDKYFIDDIDKCKNKRAIMKIISDYAIYTNKSIVAEGIETIEQRDFLKDIGNEKIYIQGYFYSKPTAIDNLHILNI